MTEILGILQAELARPQHLPQAPIQALLFDAGDILYYRPKRGDLLSDFLKELGLGPEEYNSAERVALAKQAYKGQIDQDEYHSAYLRSLGVNDPDQIARGMQILEAGNTDVQFFDGVRETLLTLKSQGFMLGIITDTANSIHAKLTWFERGGFGHVWDSIISSKELGIQKPDPEIYHAALRQLGLSTGQAAFVGHKNSELQGARAVGIKTIAFNYDKDAGADYYIENFSDLLRVPLVKGL
jgi:putative hydrolase of the HAD superfamily